MSSTAAHPLVRPIGVAWVVAAGAAALALVATGGAATLLLGDPGGLVRWGLPLLTVVWQVAAAATVGFLGLAAFLMPETTKTHRRLTACRYAAGTGLVWVVTASVALVLTFADVAGLHLSDPALMTSMGQFLVSLEVTRVALISLLLGAVAATGAAVARTRATMAWMSLVALVGVVILALTGHAAGSVGHETAVNALGIHLLGVTVWVGGLIALTVMRPSLGRDLGATATRYSTLALWSFVAVALSGIQSAWARIGSWGQLTTGYGLVVGLKVVLLIALGGFGWQMRRRLTARLTAESADGRAFGLLALSEIAVMGAAVGLGVALSRSQPPLLEDIPDSNIIENLTGYPDPGPMTTADWFLAWRVNWLFLAVALVFMGLYLAGVVKLRRRGDAWPVLRTVSWMVGWLFFIYSTMGGPGIWGRVLFSMHMMMHMNVAMLVPLFLVPAMPITLALRAIPARQDKTWGPREVILQVTHSRLNRALTNPVVAAVLFFVSLFVFYYSPAFPAALTTHTGHILMTGHFLLLGYLFTWVLIGNDPGPKKWPPLLLLVVLFVTISFHAFLGVVITSTDYLIADSFFGVIHLPWLTDPLADQVRAGEIAWGIGELPTLVIALMVARNWIKSDAAETRRKDRQADRDGDAELARYNAMLAQLSAQDRELERHGK